MNKGCEIHCVVCAVELEIEHDYLFIFQERQDWKDKKPPLKFKSAELENMHFRMPWIWGTLFRAIIPSDPNALRDEDFRRQRVDLSGVGQRGHWDDYGSPLAAPLDKDLAQIGQVAKPKKGKGRKTRKEQDFEEFYPPPLSCKPGARLSQPLAYFVHERCWHLARRVVGATDLENNLDLFLMTVHQTIRKLIKGVPWGDSEGYLCDKVLGEYSVDEYITDPQRCVQEWINKSQLGCEYPSLTNRDPMNIPELDGLITLITKAIHRRQTQPGPLLYLPPELQLMVVETLEDQRDIFHLLVALRWQLPDEHWQRRFPEKNTVFEYEHLIREDLDWQYLYFGVQRLLKKSHGLRNRQRVLQNLKLISRVFWHLMEAQGQPKVT